VLWISNQVQVFMINAYYRDKEVVGVFVFRAPLQPRFHALYGTFRHISYP
jgi:hypothetical protein